MTLTVKVKRILTLCKFVALAHSLVTSALEHVAGRNTHPGRDHSRGRTPNTTYQSYQPCRHFPR